MINYIQAKHPNFKNIEKLLTDSKETNTYTNNGPVKRQLDKRLFSLFELPPDKSVICTNSGTSALFILISFYEKKKGKAIKWVTPSFNFPAAIVNKLNTNVIDITIEENSYSIPASEIEPYEGLILPTLFGTLPKNIQEIITFCKSQSKLLILDNASSPLSKFEGKNINNFGDGCIGSLHHTKYLGYGEGGFIVIDKKYEREINALSNFGFLGNRDYSIYATNGKMSDIAAAFILSHINSYDLGQHLSIQKRFIKVIDHIDGVNVFAKSKDLIYGNLALFFEKEISHLSFRDIGIEANKYYKPLQPFSNSIFLYNRLVNLPLHSMLTDYEIEKMLQKITEEAKCTG